MCSFPRAKRTSLGEAVITHEVRITFRASGTHRSKNESSPNGLLSFLVAGVGFFIALHRRIVVCRRLDASLTLGLAYSLRLAVSLGENDTQSFSPALPTTSSVGRGEQTSLLQPTEKAPFWVPLRWLRGWDLNLTTSGL